MAGEVQDNLWPLPKFTFQVDFGEFGKANFQEVSGLDTESNPIEYRHGNNPVFAPIKMPGLSKVGNVTLKKGIFEGDDRLLELFNQIQMNTVKRQTVVISLLDEQGAPQMNWTLKNAWPTKITGTDMKADGNEVAIETLELAHEGFETERP